MFKNWGLGQFSYLKIGLLNYLFVQFLLHAMTETVLVTVWFWTWSLTDSDTLLQPEAGLSRNCDISEDLIYNFCNYALINPTQTSYNN